MIFFPLIVNAIVICVIGAELVAIAMGKISADQLLVVSSISGLLTVFSFKLSKDAMEHLKHDPNSLDEEAAK